MNGNPVSENAFRDALTHVGLCPGDTALVHSDAIIAAQLPSMPDDRRLDVLIEALENVLGPQGTLLMPTFSYSYTKGEIYDVLRTPSTVGMLTERFRTRAGVLRSLDPIFSFAAKGSRAKELCSLKPGECFGPDSAFAALHGINCHIVCLGCSLSSGGTFVHYVEKSHTVSYRYDKSFSGTTIFPDQHSEPSSVLYYVRDLARASSANLRGLQRRLEQEGRLHSAVLGRVRILAVQASDFFDTAWKMLDENPVSLIEEGSA